MLAGILVAKVISVILVQWDTMAPEGIQAMMDLLVIPDQLAMMAHVDILAMMAHVDILAMMDL